jgi:ABC-type branched-subunit amino acid transport system substrate-binding protein
MTWARAATAVLATLVTFATSVTIAEGSAGAQSSGQTTGVTSSSVTVGQVDTLSGPVPGLFLGAKDGTQGYFNMINSEGGVNGRRLHLIADDDMFQSSNYTTATNALVQSTFALVGGFSLFDGSGVPAINAAKIPDITPSLESTRELDQYNYSPVPIVEGGSRLGPFKYYKKAYGSAYLHVGTITSNVASAEAQTNGVLAAMKSLGYHISYEDVVSPFDVDFTPDILRMRQEGVQMVYIVGLAVNQSADLAKQMKQQSFVPKLFGNSGGNYDSGYIPSAGSAANGSVLDLTSALYLGQDSKAVPEVATFDKWVKAANPGANLDVYALYGWLSAELFVQALKAAGKNPTRDSLFAQLYKISQFTGNGLISTTDPVTKKPPTCWIQVKVVNNNFQRVSPSPTSGFICDPGGQYYPPGYHFTRQPPP